MKLSASSFVAGLGLLALTACAEGGGGGGTGSTSYPPERLGGDTTVFDATSQAYSLPAPNLSAPALAKHAEGDAAFEQSFVTAGGLVNPGLGPIFNNSSCVACHPADGSGRPPENGKPMLSMLVRISFAGQDPLTGGPKAAAGFGGQLQDKALLGVEPEGRVEVSYTEAPGTYPGGGAYSLREPAYALADPYIEPDEEMLLSPRIAPPVFGRGLLEAIDEADILAREDEDDADGDGISGRANSVWDAAQEALVLGRFGWKAGAPTLRQQAAGAYQQDMGITNDTFPEESSAGQIQYRDDGDDPELPSADLAAVTFYLQTLAVPALRNNRDATIVRGSRLFATLGCETCHVGTFVTGALPGVTSVSGQTIHPYTDLLLHDMGEGLADNRPDFVATGREWRTPPLWGMGLRKTVDGHTFFLHDGRARDAEEAILWHGGEAETARDKFMNLAEGEREALLKFLEAL